MVFFFLIFFFIAAFLRSTVSDSQQHQHVFKSLNSTSVGKQTVLLEVKQLKHCFVCTKTCGQLVICPLISSVAKVIPFPNRQPNGTPVKKEEL